MLLEINLPKYDSISDDDESSLDMRLFEDITSASIPDQQQIYFPDKWCKSQDLPCTSSSSSMEEMINKLSATMIRTAKTRGLQSNHILPDLIRRGARGKAKQDYISRNPKLFRPAGARKNNDSQSIHTKP